jgi:hypothetical protein
MDFPTAISIFASVALAVACFLLNYFDGKIGEKQ